jgi:hypothetical protein
MLFLRQPKYTYYLVSETKERLIFEAPDDQVAFMCGLWLGNGIAVCYRNDGLSFPGVASYFERPYSPDEYAWQYLKVDPDWFTQVHIIELDYALQSVVFFRPIGGQMLTRYTDLSEWVNKLRFELVGG